MIIRSGMVMELGSSSVAKDLSLALPLSLSILLQYRNKPRNQSSEIYQIKMRRLNVIAVNGSKMSAQILFKSQTSSSSSDTDFLAMRGSSAHCRVAQKFLIARTFLSSPWEDSE